MSIVYHESSKIFHLYNQTISYIMMVLPNGHMGQLYYGKKIRDKEDFSYLLELAPRDMASYLYENDRTFSLGHIKLEYGTYGSGDYRHPAVEILQNDGSTKKKRSCASGVEWNVSQGQNDWKRFPCLPRQPLSLATKIPLPTFPVLTNHYLQPSNRFYSAWPSYRSLPRLLLYIPHEGFDKDESLWEGGVGFREGRKGGLQKGPSSPIFQKKRRRH